MRPSQFLVRLPKGCGQQIKPAFCVLACVAVLASCSALPPPTPYASPAPAVSPAAPFAYGAIQEVVPAMIIAEREASRTGDLALLSTLWATDARIIDGRNTPETADDYVWQGRDAILDRYTIAVFPAPPPSLEPDQFDALIINTPHPDIIHAELGVDHWTLIERDGRWLLLELRYN